MSLGSHFSALASSPTAPGADFAQKPNAGSGGLAPPGSALVSSAQRESEHASLSSQKSRSEGASAADSAEFSDRRRTGGDRGASERRQFGSSHLGLSPDARELAVAIDQYKLAYRRRYITCEEMLTIIRQLGYGRGDR